MFPFENKVNRLFEKINKELAFQGSIYGNKNGIRFILHFYEIGVTIPSLVYKDDAGYVFIF